MRTSDLRVASMVLVLAGLVWVGYSAFVVRDGADGGGEGTGPSPQDGEVVEIDERLPIFLRREGESGWVCLVAGKEVRDIEALTARIKELDATGGAMVMSADVRDGATIAPIVQACMAAGLAPVEFRSLEALPEDEER